MFDLTLPTLLTRLVLLVPILGIYGFAWAGAAKILGDPGPAQDGRLTLNPVAHLDVLGVLAFLVSGLGWIAPLHLTRDRLRPPMLGIVGVLLLPVLAMLALAWLSRGLVPLAINLDSLAWGAIVTHGLQMLAVSALLFALVNLMPLPPLAAGALLRQGSVLSDWLARYRLPIGLALLALFAFGRIELWLRPPMAALVAALN